MDVHPTCVLGICPGNLWDVSIGDKMVCRVAYEGNKLRVVKRWNNDRIDLSVVAALIDAM